MHSSLASHKIPSGHPLSLEVCSSSPSLSEVWIRCCCLSLPINTCFTPQEGFYAFFCPFLRETLIFLKACSLKSTPGLLLLHISSSVAYTLLCSLCSRQASLSLPSMLLFPSFTSLHRSCTCPILNLSDILESGFELYN